MKLKGKKFVDDRNKSDEILTVMEKIATVGKYSMVIFTNVLVGLINTETKQLISDEYNFFVME